MTSLLSFVRGNGASLSRRFAFSFAAILALLVLIAAVSQALLSSSADRLTRIVGVNNHQMALANTIIGQVDDMAIALRTLTLLTDVKDIDAEVAVLGHAREAYLRTEQELAEALAANDAAAPERELLARLQATREKTLPLIAKAASLGSDGATPEATLVLMNDVRPVEKQWRELASALVARQAELNQNDHAAASATQRLASFVLLGVTVAALVIGGLMAWRLSRAVVGPVVSATGIAERIAAGDLSTGITSDRDDELGRLLRAIGTMQERLHGLVDDIRRTADSISTASAEIATGNQDLSQRTELQAASLQKTSSNVEQLTGTVRQNADAALEADRLAGSATEVAARGGRVVGQVVATMADISTSSKRIADITGVIDGIAFQTNILALNAAVEAARAGEQGRGFAVVASEVRNLAQRSAEAAREIKALIGASSERVESGARLVDEAGATMNDVVASIGQVSRLMSDISGSSRVQRDGIGQVGGEVGQLDRMTQQNAALVEQSAAAAESLRDQATRMAATARTFRLRGETDAVR